MSTLGDYTAIDPLAIIFPSAVYVRLAEKLHPHLPAIAEIQEVAKGMSPEERRFVLTRARTLSAYAKAVEEAVSAVK